MRHISGDTIPRTCRREKHIKIPLRVDNLGAGDFFEDFLGSEVSTGRILPVNTTEGKKVEEKLAIALKMW